MHFFLRISVFSPFVLAGLFWTSLITKPQAFSISWSSGKWSFRTDRYAVASSGNSGGQETSILQGFWVEWRLPVSAALFSDFGQGVSSVANPDSSSHYLWLLFQKSVQSLSHVRSLWPHGLQHTRLPCPSLSLRVCSNSCPLCHWCYPTISSSVALFSSCPQSFLASGSFPVGWLFDSDGQSIGASAWASVLPMNIQGWFPLGLTDLIS